MVLATGVAITGIVVKDEDLSPPMQFPLVVTVGLPVNRNCIPPNVTLATKSTVLNMVNRSESMERKEKKYASKRRIKRNVSFWHLPCVLLVGVLINPAFGLVAALILSLEKSDEGKPKQRQTRTWRRIGIGLLVTGIIVSLWAWSSVFIYYYAVYSEKTRYAEQLKFSGNQVPVKSLISIDSPTHPTTQGLALGSSNLDTVGQFDGINTLTRTSTAPNVPVSSTTKAVKHTTLSPLHMQGEMAPRSHGTPSEKTTTSDDLLYTKSMSSDVIFATYHSAAVDSSTSSTEPEPSFNMLSSTGKPFTAQIHPITFTNLQRQNVIQKTTKVLQRFRTIPTLPPTTIVESTTDSKSDLPRLKSEDKYDQFIAAMKRFAADKSIVGL